MNDTILDGEGLEILQFCTKIFPDYRQIALQNVHRCSIPKPKTNFLKNSFSYRGAACWNNIPTSLLNRLKESTSLRAVQNLINDYI